MDLSRLLLSPLETRTAFHNPSSIDFVDSPMLPVAPQAPLNFVVLRWEFQSVQSSNLPKTEVDLQISELRIRLNDHRPHV